VSCAKLTPLSLKNRTLLIHPDKAELVFPYCEKRKWLSGKCKTKVVDTYDLNDKEMRDKLNLLGFECSVPKEL